MTEWGIGNAECFQHQFFIPHSKLRTHDMGLLIRILFVLGILCLMMNFVGAVGSYYATLRNLSEDPDASVDALAGSAAQLQSDPWPTFGWTALGVALIAAAIVLGVTRRRRRRGAY